MYIIKLTNCADMNVGIYVYGSKYKCVYIYENACEGVCVSICLNLCM